MPRRYPDALAASRRLLRALVFLNLLMGVLIFALLVASLIAEGAVMGALGVPPGEGSGRLILGGRAIMVLGLLAVPLGHSILTRLQAIVGTVALGDPFVSANAERLETIAWTVLALEILHLVVGAVAFLSSSGPHSLNLGWNLSITRWLALLFCFVLARVFARGTQMREDLEGTV
jgi:hypothetical protein